MYGNPVEVTLELHDEGPSPQKDADRVTEVSLSGSGPLGVLSWGETEAELSFDLPEGSLRLRASHSGLAAADAHPDNDVSGEELSPERILLQLWPGPLEEPAAIRAWPADHREQTTRSLGRSQARSSVALLRLHRSALRMKT